MFSHIMIGTNDIERSKSFYDAVLGVFGVGEPLRNVAKTGHTTKAARFASASPSTAKWPAVPTAARLALSAIRPNR